MYQQPHFREDRIPLLHEAIRRSGLSTLVTIGHDGIEASHVPMLLDTEPAPHGTLVGHLARANPQWQTTLPETPGLAIFLGPDAYVTPSWYATKAATGKVVPTWNYVAVHATGRVRFFEDQDELLALVTRLTQVHESSRPSPWAVSDAPADFIQSQLKGIVGFALTIERIEGKWKMSQNRVAEDRAGVIAGLAAGSEREAEVSALVAAADKRRKT